jgi:molybdopterin synthase catalytic subunit
MMGYLGTEPIGVDDLVQAVLAPDRGGVATFLGVVRNQHAGRPVARLEYTAYAAMAEAECGRIVTEAESRWPCRIALRHRLGTLEIGETAVAVVAAAAHREDAFVACRHVIDEVKRRVPIWKREVYADGREAWVDPTAEGGIVPARGASSS